MPEIWINDAWTCRFDANALYIYIYVCMYTHMEMGHGKLSFTNGDLELYSSLLATASL